MRKLFTVLIAAILCVPCRAQQLSEADFKNKCEELNEQVRTAVKSKDYGKAENLTIEALNLFNRIPLELEKKYSGAKGTIWYDIACYRSMQGKTEDAVEAFEEAVENGWQNYRHTLADSDLDNIRGNEKFKLLLESIRKKGDFVYILSEAAPFDDSENTASLPAFRYQSADDPELIRVREHFNLDSIAGRGDEMSKIKNLLYWAHNIVRHDGSSNNPVNRNAIDIVEVCKKENRGVNCRMMAILLNECYLAMGFKSRFVTCLPKRHNDPDCHVINAVYCETLDKWLWVDPTFNAYVMDENGNMLSIAEVRERLRTNRPLAINEDANWNNQNKQTKEQYIDGYMSKNLYYLQCPTYSGYNVETKRGSTFYVNLIPPGYTPRSNDFKTSSESYFWRKP